MKLIIMFLLLLGVMVYAAAPSGSEEKSQIQPTTPQDKQEEQDRMEKLKFHTREDDPKVQGKYYDDNHPEKMKYQTDEDSSKEGEI